MNSKTLHRLILILIALLVLTMVGRQFGLLNTDEEEPVSVAVEETGEGRKADYSEVKSHNLPIKNPTSMVVTKDGILVGGGDQLLLLDSEGQILIEKSLPDVLHCLTVDAENGEVFAVVGKTVVRLNPDGHLSELFSIPGAGRIITAIAVAQDSIFLADAEDKEVLRLGLDGRLLQKIGGPRKQGDVPGFVIPSPYFDMNVDSFGNLWVVNPGRHTLNHFEPDGSIVSSWGEASYAVEGFCGCCNPTAFSILPNGRFLTAEKGVARVKIYGPDGSFQELIAGPDAFDEGTVGLVLGSLKTGEIVVMDPSRKSLRYFERRGTK